jgi:hypothetical protein
LRRHLVMLVPVLNRRLSSCWVHLLTPLSRNIAKPLGEGLKNPIVCRVDWIIPPATAWRARSRMAALATMAEHYLESWSRRAAEVEAGRNSWLSTSFVCQQEDPRSVDNAFRLTSSPGPCLRGDALPI